MIVVPEPNATAGWTTRVGLREESADEAKWAAWAANAHIRSATSEDRPAMPTALKHLFKAPFPDHYSDKIRQGPRGAARRPGTARDTTA
jgi:hypothetical protein